MMKKLVFILASLCLVCGCYDDSELRQQIKDHESRILKLETLCKKFNTQIESVQNAVNALNNKDYVESVTPIKEGTKVIGYEIRFSKSGSCQIYHGEDGKNGKDGNTPKIGVKQFTDGIWYWTCDGVWVLDNNGEKIKAEGEDAITPKFKIQEEYWYVTYDGGKTWERLDRATGDDGDDFFQSVTETDDAVILVLADGTTINIPKKKKIDILFNDINDAIGVVPGAKTVISYEIVNGTDQCLVKAFGQNGWRAYVKAESAKKGTIEIYAPEELTNDEIIVLVYDGETTTIMKALKFEEGVIICNVSAITVKGSGETLTVGLESNLAVSAKSSADWISTQITPATKGTVPYDLILTVNRNYSNSERIATVAISDSSGEVVHTIGVIQPIYDEFESYVDLSYGGETANCYLINKSGEYKFPIIKGNGQRGVVRGGESAELPNAVKARIVWQDGNILTSVGVNKGYVVFATYSTWRKGNAVVAVTDENDNILWNWHIWSTDYILGSGDIPVYNHARTRLYKMMKYTLGENGNTATFYQFGRKDPFSLHTTLKTASGGNLSKSILNPDTYYVSSGYDWCSESYKDWWDAGYTSYNSSSTVASVLKGNKTIYDPCPAGYRVPPDDAFTSFTKDGRNTENESNINATNPDWIAFLQNNNTYYFYTQNGSSTIRYKAFGGLNAGTGKELTNIAYYYSAHPSYSSTSRLLQFYAGVVNPLCTDYSRALGGTIRPVRDDVKSEQVYESKDYSQDGTIITLQKHSVGNGCKILIVGDGFTDQDIASGKYDRSMSQAMEYFFDIEPYKSFRNRFEVKSMRVVSRTSVFDEEKRTAFESVMGSGAHIDGNLSKAYQKVYDVYGGLDGVVVIIVMNTKEYGGTCYMAGNTISVAFCPMSEQTYYPFNTVIHHEAGGHGFANLGDEYYYDGTTISQEDKNFITSAYNDYGWYENLSITSDKTKVNWRRFITDPLYSSSVGVYQGAYGFSYGVYRPTKNSCMNNMYGDFNAPSRYAIYKRIMERSGEPWSWEKFVEYDAINRATEATASMGYDKYDSGKRPNHAPPVFVSPESLPKF